MSGSYSSRLRAGSSAGGGLAATTLLAAKVAFASAALAAAVSLARVAVPRFVSGADAFLFKLYLFVTVHVIIFVIWKLSDNKHFHAAAHKDPWAPTPHHPAPPLLTEEVVAVKRKVELAPVGAARAEEYRMPPPHLGAAMSPVDEGVLFPGSCGGDSCVTTECEEDACSSTVAASAYIAAADTWRSAEPAPAPARKRAVVNRGFSLPPPPAFVSTDEHFDGAGNDDDLDATWNAIMQKTRPATAPALSASSPSRRSSPPPPPEAPSPRPRAREPSVGAAELSKRSEDFINKIHNSFGRQQ